MGVENIVIWATALTCSPPSYFWLTEGRAVLSELFLPRSICLEVTCLSLSIQLFVFHVLPPLPQKRAALLEQSQCGSVAPNMRAGFRELMPRKGTWRELCANRCTTRICKRDLEKDGSAVSMQSDFSGPFTPRLYSAHRTAQPSKISNWHLISANTTSLNFCMCEIKNFKAPCSNSCL